MLLLPFITTIIIKLIIFILIITPNVIIKPNPVVIIKNPIIITR